MNHDSLSATGYILQRARQVASTIETKSPDLVRSRPCLRWIQAEAEHSHRFEGDVIRQHFSRFPGVTVYRSLVPIYIPKPVRIPVGRRSLRAHSILGLSRFHSRQLEQ